VLSRPPLLTPDPHPFEAAYHLYSRRLNERLVLPFTQHFYYKRGTPAFEHWRTQRRERGGAATRDIGAYNAYDKEAWNDEVRVGSKVGGMHAVVQALLAEEGKEDSDQGGSPLAGFTRESTDDERSLERRLMRTVYLLVKRRRKEGSRDGDGWWGFPSGAVEGAEGVRDTAQRVLRECAGAHMNTWFVGRHPVGWYGWSRQRPVDAHGTVLSTDQAEGNEMVTVAEKTFFIKSRIMAGQANVHGNARHVVDFKWLCKEEVQKVVTPAYWAGVKNMLVEQ
jgi:large subunit ribosomal protein L46